MAEKCKRSDLTARRRIHSAGFFCNWILLPGMSHIRCVTRVTENTNLCNIIGAAHDMRMEVNMGKLYFARHGQTVWNAENKICGATDIPLTKLGHEQAMELGRMISRAGYEIEEILYSPLVRAAETARHIHEITGIPLRAEMRLKEQNFGKWESTPRDGAEFQAAKAQFVCRYEGGESMMQMAQRIYNLLDELRREPEGRTYLLVAHNGIARIVQSYFTDMTNEEFAAFGIGNCQVLEYTW